MAKEPQHPPEGARRPDAPPPPPPPPKRFFVDPLAAGIVRGGFLEDDLSGMLVGDKAAKVRDMLNRYPEQEQALIELTREREQLQLEIIQLQEDLEECRNATHKE